MEISQGFASLFRANSNIWPWQQARQQEFFKKQNKTGTRIKDLISY